MPCPGVIENIVIRRRSLALLAQVFWLALSLPGTTRADIFRIVDSEREAAQVRIDMIQQAQKEIVLELYRASDDQMSLSYLALLRDAARRGVSVKFLIDGVFNLVPKRVQAHLIQEGIEIKEYHPLRITKPGWFSRRLHDKLLLTDREEMLVGGRNIEDPFFGLGSRNYVDRDVYVRGKAAARAHAYFTRLWNSREVRETALGAYDPKVLQDECDDSIDEISYDLCVEEKRTRTAREFQRVEVLLDKRKAALNKIPFVHLNPATDWSAGQRDLADVRFLNDPIGGKGKAPGTFEVVLAYMDAARESILIESPYLILSKNSKEVLRRATERGVRVRVLTNSLASTQNLFAQGGYEGKKAKLVQMGLEIWEYKGPKTLHAKSVVIDDKVAIIGNFNIDPRSEFLNTELAVVAHDPEQAQRLRRSMDRHLANARMIGPDGRAVGEDRRFPGASTGKIIKLRFFQAVAPLIKKQL